MGRKLNKLRCVYMYRWIINIIALTAACSSLYSWDGA